MLFYFLSGGVVTILGILFFSFPPKKINSVYGYRTRRSKRNQEVWDAANHYSAILMILAGVLTLLSGAICVLFGASVIIPNLMVIIFLILLMIFTERYLKQRFG